MTNLLLISLLVVVAGQAAVIVVLLAHRTLGVGVEVWAVTADELGIFLVSRNASGHPDAWRTGQLPLTTMPHQAVTRLLEQHGELTSCVFRHSTSWRPDWRALARRDRPIIVLTYVAVLGMNGDAGGMLARPPRPSYRFAYEIWPWVAPIHKRLVDLDSAHRFHGPNQQPAPAYLDVLMHGIRHLLFLLWTDTVAQAQLDRHWRRWLAELGPALAGMYVHGMADGVSETQ